MPYQYCILEDTEQLAIQLTVQEVLLSHRERTELHLLVQALSGFLFFVVWERICVFFSSVTDSPDSPDRCFKALKQMFQRTSSCLVNYIIVMCYLFKCLTTESFFYRAQRLPLNLSISIICGCGNISSLQQREISQLCFP